MSARRLQFRLSVLMSLTTVCAVVFGAFRWLGLSPVVSLFISAMMAISLVAAASLVFAIAGSASGDRPDS